MGPSTRCILAALLATAAASPILEPALAQEPASVTTTTDRPGAPTVAGVDKRQRFGGGVRGGGISSGGTTDTDGDDDDHWWEDIFRRGDDPPKTSSRETHPPPQPTPKVNARREPRPTKALPTKAAKARAEAGGKGPPSSVVEPVKSAITPQVAPGNGKDAFQKRDPPITAATQTKAAREETRTTSIIDPETTTVI